MSDPPTSDEELIRRFNEGDAEAFDVFYGRHRQALYNFILRSVRRPERAEEIFQETFLRVIQRSHEFKGSSKVSTWVYAIARNLCVDHGRRMVFRRHASLDAPARGRREVVEGATLVDRTASPTPGPEDEASQHALARRVTIAVEELPDEQREVFLLRRLEGLAFKDIAEIVGVAESTAKSRMRYALERLRRAIEDEDGHDPESR